MEENRTIHVFERAGLGKAPFRFIALSEERGPKSWTGPDGVTITVGSPGQPMAACDYCGTSIAECCHIRSADGKEFKVGNNCVAKTGDRGLRDPVKTAINKARTARRNEREVARINAALELWKAPEVKAAAAAIAHPKDWAAKQGQTMKDQIEWMLDNAGQSGRLRTARVIEKLSS